MNQKYSYFDKINLKQNFGQNILIMSFMSVYISPSETVMPPRSSELTSEVITGVCPASNIDEIAAVTSAVLKSYSKL